MARIGAELHKSLGEVEAMTVSEFNLWLAYFGPIWKARAKR